MLAYGAKRLVVALGVLLAVSLLTFVFTNVAVDPARAIAGEAAGPDTIEQIRRQYGFDRPIPIRYLAWLNGVVHGDLGISIRQQRPIIDALGTALPITMFLATSALCLALAIALPLGVMAALHPNSWLDRVCLWFAVLGMAMPTFWFALILIIVFGLWLGLTPISGYETPLHFVLPTLTLSSTSIPIIMRLTRTGMIEVLSADYIRTARAKGLLAPAILFKHALRNAVIPVVSIAAVQFGAMLAGSVVIESIFAIQGIGYLAYQAISSSDLPMVQAIILVVAFFYVALVFVADVVNGILDPRIRVA